MQATRLLIPALAVLLTAAVHAASDPFDAYVADVRAHNLLLGAEYCIGEAIPVDVGRLAELDYLEGGLHALKIGGEKFFFWGAGVPDDVDEFADGHVIVRPIDTWVLGDFGDNRLFFVKTQSHDLLIS